LYLSGQDQDSAERAFRRALVRAARHQPLDGRQDS
jgi:hypothetical protein